MKTLLNLISILLIILVLKSCVNCKDSITDMGTISLTTYDKAVFFNSYSPNQTIRFIKNKKDTIVMQTSNAYESSILNSSVANEASYCSSGYNCHLENYFININTPFKDSSFYLFTQANYSKSFSDFRNKTPGDTLSSLSFGLNTKGYYPGVMGTIFLNADNFNTDSLLVNNLSINGIIYNRVYYYKNPRYVDKIYDIYFHPSFGVLKFSFYKVNSSYKQGIFMNY